MPNALAGGGEPPSLQMRPELSPPPGSPQSAPCPGGLSLMSFPQGYKLATHHFFPFIDRHY